MPTGTRPLTCIAVGCHKDWTPTLLHDLAVEIRDDPPPAPPLKRLRLDLKNGQPNIEAVSHYIGTCLDGTLLPMYISLVNLGDTNSWGECPYIADENSIEYSRMKVQN